MKNKTRQKTVNILPFRIILKAVGINMNLIDCHCHTANSPDGEGSVKQLCMRASELGLAVLGISEHCEANRLYSKEHYGSEPKNEYEIYDNICIFEKSMAENTASIYECPKNLTLLCGIELGQPYADFYGSQSLIEDKRLDFVIASAHELCGKEDFAFLKYTKENVNGYLKEYFETIYQMCKWGKFDILAHLTYPLRYINGIAKLNVDISQYNEIISESFRLLIQNGKGIEINTSGLRQPYGLTFPTLEYVKLFKELGGEIISIGSDAHCADDLGKGIIDGIKLAEAGGFKYISYFKNRKPEFIKI